MSIIYFIMFFGKCNYIFTFFQKIFQPSTDRSEGNAQPVSEKAQKAADQPAEAVPVKEKPARGGAERVEPEPAPARVEAQGQQRQKQHKAVDKIC